MNAIAVTYAQDLFRGRGAHVTGSSSGIGLACAQMFRGLGADVTALGATAAERERTDGETPGWMRTPLQDDPERSRPITARTPIGRWGETDEVAAPIAFLASPAARFVTGAILPVDGGYLTL